MQIIHAETGVRYDVVVERLSDADYESITKKRYFFNWKTEKGNRVYKLKLTHSEEILGLMSLLHYEEEHRFEIKLLAVSRENRGKYKQYEGISGNLIAFACREARRLYAIDGCVSLVPKTKLRVHYIKMYGMIDSGYQLFLEGPEMTRLLIKYKV